MSEIDENTPSMKEGNDAWVVFSGRADLPWLKLLKPGFRHCFVVLNDGQHWITLDPLSNYMDIIVHAVPPEFDFPGWLSARGHMVVKTICTQPPKSAPWGLFSCVEAVKRVLGLHSPFVFTPWQLYRRLTVTPSPLRRKPNHGSVLRTLNSWIPFVQVFTARRRQRDDGLIDKQKGAFSWEA